MNVHIYDKILSIKPSEEVQLWLSLQDHKHLDKKRAAVVNYSALFTQITL